MEIDKYFIDEEKRLRDFINELPMQNCIENLFTYALSNKIIEKECLESEFKSKLNNELQDFVADKLRKHYLSLDKEGLIRVIEDNQSNGGYDLYYTIYEADEPYCILTDIYTDFDLYLNIKEFMLKCLNEITIDTRRTQIEKEIDNVTKMIASKKEFIENENKRVSQMEEELEELLKKKGES